MNSHANFKAIYALDLDQIKFKLMHLEAGEGWDLAKATAVEEEYRRFLCVMQAFPDEPTSPMIDVDTFWHYHILDTMKYAADCEAAFGYFVHHFPYLGLRGADDEKALEASGDRMRDLYEQMFGEPYAQALAAWCASPGDAVAKASWCASPGDAVAKAAWCASPGKAVAKAAWCASPGQVVSAKAAWCASPGKAVTKAAWCASPGKVADKAVAKAAWCASPGKVEDKAVAKAAWCASPGKVADKAVAKAAWCASPGNTAARADMFARADENDPVMPA